MGMIWLLSRRDLRWRWRRLVMALAGTTVAFALTLVLTGVREGVDLEANRTVESLGADAFVVSDSVTGPFTSLGQIPAAWADQLSQGAGIEDAAAVVSVRHRVESAPATDVYLVGAVPGRVGMPDVSEGRAPQREGEAAIGSAADRRIGDRVEVGGRDLEIVGIVSGASVWLTVPVLYTTLSEAQALVFGGEPAATVLLTRGVPDQLPDGLKILTPSEAVSDLLQPLETAVDTISFIQVLLWIMAATIVGSMLYISALDRARDFAVLKAFGTRNSTLAGTLVFEAFVISTVSALGALALSRPLGTLHPAVVSLPAWTVFALIAFALAVGAVGALAGARRAVAVDPAEAFASL